MIQISLVPPERAEAVWPLVSTMIERALRYSGGRFRLQDVLDDLRNGDQTLWIALDEHEIIGCTTIRITQYPSGIRSLCYEHLGGSDVRRWLTEGHDTCRRYARAMGCDTLECQGRSGWKPFLEELGYRQYAVRYEFKIED